MIRLSTTITLALVSAVLLSAQSIGLKTNALYWLTTTPNIGVEIGLGKHTTFDISAGYNPFTLDRSGNSNTKFKHVKADPELRYWFCERFYGHYIGINALYSYYNVGNIPLPFVKDSKGRRYQGWMAGAGMTYGYSWVIGRRWNIEAGVGVGYMYSEYDIHRNEVCGIFIDNGRKHIFGLTELGISFIYMIK